MPIDIAILLIICTFYIILAARSDPREVLKAVGISLCLGGAFLLVMYFCA